MNSIRTILVLLLLAAKLVIGQEIPGSTAKADVNSLQAAVRAHPDNVGLKLRLTQAILLASKEESHPDKKAAAIAEVQALWKACLASNPAAFIPLRALARDAYYARDMSAAIDFGRRALASDPTDSEMATVVVKALVRSQREAEAIDLLMDNFRQQGMPAFAQSQGLISALVTNSKIRDLLEKGLVALVAERPNATLIRLAYAGYLSEVGRFQDAWAEFHRAEKEGLCDTGSGGRHPFGSLLADKLSEPSFPGAFAGVDLQGLEKQVEAHPNHAGVVVRLARRYELPATEKLDPMAAVVAIDESARRVIEQALATYGQALKHNAECWPAQFRSGELLLLLDRPKEAAPLFERAARSFPVFLPAWLELAIAKARSGDMPGAGAALAEFALRNDSIKGTTQFLETGGPKSAADFKAIAKALTEAAASRPSSLTLPAHLSIVQLRAGDIADAKASALLAERNGLIGRNALPHPALLEAFGIKVPTTAADR